MKEYNEKRSNLGLKICLVVLSILVIGLSGFIVYDKFISENNNQNKIEEKDKNKNVDDQINFDLSKVDFQKSAINGNSGEVYELMDKKISYISTKLLDNNTIIISIDFSKYGIYFSNFEVDNNIKEYKVNNFTKKVNKVYLYPYTTSGETVAALYLMEDGTVEYTLIYEQLKNDPTVSSMKSSGKILNVSGVETIVFAYKNNTNEPAALDGNVYALAVKRDGTFYELTF